jgi:hypothetical protein
MWWVNSEVLEQIFTALEILLIRAVLITAPLQVKCMSVMCQFKYVCLYIRSKDCRFIHPARGAQIFQISKELTFTFYASEGWHEGMAILSSTNTD